MAKITRKSNADQLRRAIDDIQRKRVNVGWFETQRYEDGTPVAYVATIQEFGHGSIPPRPFMRPTIAEQRAAWRDTLARGSKRVLNGQMEIQQMLLAFGLSAAGDVAQTIKAVTAPPLAPATLKARQSKKKTPGVSNKPLVDTGQMLQSVTAQVSDK